MNTNDGMKFFDALAQKAMSGKHNEIELLRNYREYKITKILKKSLNKIVGGFKQSLKAVEKAIKAEPVPSKNVGTLLLNASILNTCIEYYQKEVDNVDYMLSEYNTYILHGHWLKLLFGIDRPEEDLVDYIKKNYI